jgi:hypothetical protein
MIDLRYLKKVLEMLDESTVDSLEITSDKGMKLRVSKSPTQRGGAMLGTPMLAGGQSLRQRRHACLEGADSLHHRGHEDHERNRV